MIYYIILDFSVLGNSNNNLKFRQSYLRNLKKWRLSFVVKDVYNVILNYTNNVQRDLLKILFVTKSKSIMRLTR